MQNVLLAAKVAAETLQTEDGGIAYVTIDHLSGGVITTTSGSDIPKHDEVVVTNNVLGSPTVVVYKLLGATVLTITNTYDGNNFLTHSVWS